MADAHGHVARRQRRERQRLDRGRNLAVGFVEDEGGKPVATLRGTISDSDASIYGGEFVRGGNPVCTSLEIALQEWLPDNGAGD